MGAETACAPRAVGADNRVCTIYLIKNAVNGKLYVGQTWGALVHRLRDHIYAASRPRGCVKLYRALLKYGQEAFTIEALVAATSQEEGDSLEDRYIVELNTIAEGYNIRRGGSCGEHSIETRQKISASKKGKVVITAETRAKISKALIGRKKGSRSEETLQKMRNAHLGKKHSIEVRERMSAAHAGKLLSETQRAGISEGKKVFWASLAPEDRRKRNAHGIAAMAAMSPEQLKARGSKIVEARRRNRVLRPKPEDIRVIRRAAELRAGNADMTLRAIGIVLAEEGYLSKNNTVLKSRSIKRLLLRADAIGTFDEKSLAAVLEILKPCAS